MDSRKCGSCGDAKPEGAFAFRSRTKGNHGAYYRNSKQRFRERQRARRAAIRAAIDSAKDVHRDRRLKRFSIAAFWSVTLALDVVLAEIAKCDIVCANCHRIRTHRARAYLAIGSRLTAGQRPLKP